MLGTVAVVQWNGRVQSVQMLTTLRHFGRGLSAAAPLTTAQGSFHRALAAGSDGQASLAACWGSSKASSRRHTAWRCLVAHQLHVAANVGTAAPLAASGTRAIQPGEVHIWWLDPTKVSSEDELLHCSDLLAEDELRDCNSADEPAVRRERLLARSHVRYVLAGYLAGSPHPRALLFERNLHGKPHLLWPTATPGGHNLRFNLTHTASLIGLAVTVEGLVGLDVEAAERRTRSDPMRLAQRRFSEQEIADMQACPDSASRAAYFVQLWTLKEAYVKALGRGISAAPGLRSFTFRVGSQQQQAQRQDQVHQQSEQQHEQVQQHSSQQGQQGQQGQSERQQVPEPLTPPRQHEPALAVEAMQAAVQEQLGQESSDNAIAAMEAAVQQQAEHQQQQQQRQQWHPSWPGSGWAAASDGECEAAAAASAAAIRFHTSAPDLRRWQFALLQPAPGHMAALVVECSTADSSSSGDDGFSSSSGSSVHGYAGSKGSSLDGFGSSASLDGSGSSGSSQQGMRVLNFEVHPSAMLGGKEQPAQPLVLAHGLYCP